MAGLAPLQLEGGGLEKVRGTTEVGPDLDQQPVRPWIDAAATEVGDPSLGVGGQRAGTERDADTGRRFSGGAIEDVSRHGDQFAHNPARSSGFTGARRNAQPVA